MFQRKTRAGDYLRVKMGHVEVSVSDNFEFILELIYKLLKTDEIGLIKIDENGDDMTAK